MKKGLLSLFAFGLLFGAFGAVTHKAEPVEANAVTINVGTTLYLKPSADWYEADARFAAYFFSNGGGNAWVSFEKIPTVLGIYSVTSPTGSYDNVIFVRMNPANQVNNWGNKWNQTADLVYDGTKNLYSVVGWEGGAWETYNASNYQIPTATTAGIDANKVRIWIDRNGNYDGVGYTTALKIGGVRYSPTGHEKALKLGVNPGENDKYFPYFDLPKSTLSGAIGISIIKDSIPSLEVEVPAVTYSEGDNNKVWKIVNNSGTWSISKGAITERVYNTFVAKVLEGYLTCLDSEINGYLAIDDIETNFIPNTNPTTWNVEGMLSAEGITLVDYAGVGTSNYSSSRGTGVVVSAQSKYDAMQDLYSHSGAWTRDVSMIESSNNVSIQLILVMSILALTSLAGFYLITKKRKYN